MNGSRTASTRTGSGHRCGHSPVLAFVECGRKLIRPVNTSGLFSPRRAVVGQALRLVLDNRINGTDRTDTTSK